MLTPQMGLDLLILQLELNNVNVSYLITWNKQYYTANKQTWTTWAISHETTPILIMTPIHSQSKPDERLMCAITGAPSGKSNTTGVNIVNFITSSAVYCHVYGFSVSGI